MFDLTREEDREQLVIQINTEANKARKQVSLRQFEIQSGRIEEYVREDLLGQYNSASVKEMPIVSSINVQKRIVDKKANLYKKPPERIVKGISDDEMDTVKLIYRDMDANEKLNQANKGFEYQDQSIGMVVPKDGKLIMRVFKMHQIDAIIDPIDPESAKGFIISTFDRANYIQLDSEKSTRDTATGFTGRSVRSAQNETDGDTLDIANNNQYRKFTGRYIVWTPEFNYMQNEKGQILDPLTDEVIEGTQENIVSPLASQGMHPFFEVYREKDFEFFTRPSSALSDFTVQFNSRLSDEGNNIKMNGYAVGVLKAPSDMQPENLVIGAAMLLRLNTDDENKEVDFQFVTPGSNIGEISSANDRFLNYFITTEGLGSDTVNAQGQTEKFTSGTDRFIAMVDRLESSADTIERFRNAEQRIYEIIKAWQEVLKSTDQLDSKYKVSLPFESELFIQYHQPEMVETRDQIISTIERKMDLGLMSKVEAIMELRGIEDRDKAVNIVKQIFDDNNVLPVQNTLQIEDNSKKENEEKEEDK